MLSFNEAGIEAAIQAVNECDWTQVEFGIAPDDRELAQAALSAALPHIVVDEEKLAAIIEAAQVEYLREDLPEDGLTESQTIARAIAEAVRE